MRTAHYEIQNKQCEAVLELNGVEIFRIPGTWEEVLEYAEGWINDGAESFYQGLEAKSEGARECADCGKHDWSVGLDDQCRPCFEAERAYNDRG